MSERPRKSSGQITFAAWQLVIDGAQSYVEDALDEEGEHHPEDWAAIVKEAQRVITAMREGDVGWK